MDFCKMVTSIVTAAAQLTEHVQKLFLLFLLLSARLQLCSVLGRGLFQVPGSAHGWKEQRAREELWF